jgi:hypothetical protein
MPTASLSSLHMSKYMKKFAFYGILGPGIIPTQKCCPFGSIALEKNYS